MANWRAWLTRAARQPALPCRADSRAIMDEAMSGSPGEHALQDALGTRDRAARFSRDQVSAVLTPRPAAARPWRVGTWRANAGPHPPPPLLLRPRRHGPSEARQDQFPDLVR